MAGSAVSASFVGEAFGKPNKYKIKCRKKTIKNKKEEIKHRKKKHRNKIKKQEREIRSHHVDELRSQVIDPVKSDTEGIHNGR